MTRDKPPESVWLVGTRSSFNLYFRDIGGVAIRYDLHRTDDEVSELYARNLTQAKLLREKQAEIDRLRKLASGYRDDFDRASVTIDKQRQEIERLNGIVDGYYEGLDHHRADRLTPKGTCESCKHWDGSEPACMNMKSVYYNWETPQRGTCPQFEKIESEGKP